MGTPRRSGWLVLLVLGLVALVAPSAATAAPRHGHTRVDPKTGATTTYASGLPPKVIGIGGAMDIAFLGRTAYVLVTLVGPDVGGSDVVGIYRVDGPDSCTVVASNGQFALD